jgi:Zn-dependent M28 family amino/carboxypeptidase
VHYDFVDGGCGAVDNWTGIVSVAHLFRTIRTMPANKSLLFVAFGQEEKGLLGSKAMLKAIPKQEIPSYCAMINLDSFGLARPFALTNASSKSLVSLAMKRAEELKIPFPDSSIPGADADSSSFKAAGIPAVTLSGVSNDWRLILHTPNDQASQIISASVWIGYRLALTVWQSIDAAPCAAFRITGEKQ